MFSSPKLKVSKHKASPIFAQVHAHDQAEKGTVQSTLKRPSNLVREKMPQNCHKLIVKLNVVDKSLSFISQARSKGLQQPTL